MAAKRCYKQQLYSWFNQFMEKDVRMALGTTLRWKMEHFCVQCMLGYSCEQYELDACIAQ